MLKKKETFARLSTCTSRKESEENISLSYFKINTYRIMFSLKRLNPQLQQCFSQESRREGWTDARSAVGFCLGCGLFGSYNSD